MEQIVREAALGIGDILKEIAEPDSDGFRLRANRPDLLVVDPFVLPLFKQAEALAQELGIPLPQITVVPTYGLHTLLDARVWSRGVNPIPGIESDPLQWLETHGFEETRRFLIQTSQETRRSGLRILAIGGTRDSELPYVERPDEQIQVSQKQAPLRVNEVFLTPDYFPQEDGPLDMEALSVSICYAKDSILHRIYY